jgi:hypothetical protein
MAKPPFKPVVVDVFTNMVKVGANDVSEAVLNFDFCLRDRDFIRSTIGQPPSNQKTVCVGDNALLIVEEVLGYPENPLEARQRSIAVDKKKVQKDEKTPSKKIRVDTQDREVNAPDGKEIKWLTQWPKANGRDRGAPLRAPALSSEYAASGLVSVFQRCLSSRA